MGSSGPVIFLSAGEASGEHYGVLLMQELLRRAPGVKFFGLGGVRMEALGLRRVVKAEDVAVMGITEVIRHMPRIYGEYLKLKAAIRNGPDGSAPGAGMGRPDVAVLIDFPDVNLRLAEDLHRLGIPVIFFVSPQLWAWKKGRIRRVRRYVDRMLVIFPFEEPFYRERGVDAVFVGHPLSDVALPSVSRTEFARANGLDAARQWIGLLPGSRLKEIRLNLPEMLKAARMLLELEPRSEFLLPVAPTLTLAQTAEVSNILEQFGCDPETGGLPLEMVRDARATLLHARASMVASGTATVEAALIGNPFVVVYRVSALTYWIAKRVVTVPHVAMVNLIAGLESGNRVVPELIQDDFQAKRIVQELTPLLSDGKARAEMMAGLRTVQEKLHGRHGAGETAIAAVASITLDALGIRIAARAAEHI